ncbi:class I SAM-dependent methyltransferase [Akkermansiaceae bacterium]|nr:class I SAM-dependent methyltransferase [Akkermansiaceae bacterium]MDB4411849.1 class I SAM-dependent methyltransferase [Akkermansiaceae bacterium]
MGRYPATYFQCPGCKLIKPSPVTWLEKAYASAITDCDVGLVSRNFRNRRILVPMFDLLLEEDDHILDVGGGYGLLCRVLRDCGFKMASTDPYCENLFAVGHEPKPDERYRMLCAFEVFEHLEDPMDFVRAQMDKYSPDFFCFSTLCYEGASAPAKDWHYYAFETGQHISFYHAETLEQIAKEFGMHYFGLDAAYHLFHREPLTAGQLRLLKLHSWFSRFHYLWVSAKRRGKSLTAEDYENARIQLRTSQKDAS